MQITSLTKMLKAACGEGCNNAFEILDNISGNSNSDIASSNSSTYAIDTSDYRTILFLSLQQLVSLLSCSGNLLVLYVFILRIKKRSSTSIFVANLAVADFLTGIATSLQVFYTVFEGLNRNMVTCLLRYQTITTLTLTSQLIVTFTTLDRFIAVCFPHTYAKLMTYKTVIILVLTSWGYSLVLNGVPIFVFNRWSEEVDCIYPYLFDRIFYLLTGISLYVFMLIAVLLYMFILHKAWVLQRKVFPIVDQNRERISRAKRDIRSAKVIGIVTLFFTVCWIPYGVYHIKFGVKSVTGDDIAVSNWLVFLGLCNSFMNPFIYAWQRKDFRFACQKLFHFGSRNNDVSVSMVMGVTTQQVP